MSNFEVTLSAPLHHSEFVDLTPYSSLLYDGALEIPLDLRWYRQNRRFSGILLYGCESPK